MAECDDHRSIGNALNQRDSRNREQRLDRFYEQLAEATHPRHAWWFASISRIAMAVASAIMVITWLIFGWSIIALSVALVLCIVFVIACTHWAGTRAPSVRILENAVNELLDEDEPPSQP